MDETGRSRTEPAPTEAVADREDQGRFRLRCASTAHPRVDEGPQGVVDGVGLQHAGGV
jgi:hypothetical protein